MSELPILLERKLIHPLDNVSKAGPVGPEGQEMKWEEFAPGALEAVRVGGRITVLQLLASVYTLFYDRALFGSAGVPEPNNEWTWDSVVEAGTRLTRVPAQPTNPVDQSSQLGILAHNSTPLLLTLIWSHGGEFVSADGKRVLLVQPSGSAAAGEEAVR